MASLAQASIQIVVRYNDNTTNTFTSANVSQLELGISAANQATGTVVEFDASTGTINSKHGNLAYNFKETLNGGTTIFYFTSDLFNPVGAPFDFTQFKTNV